MKPLQSKQFQRRQEDFVCENCNETVHGDGYTDHCPTCLWSKHVDINPGDRQCECKGLMQPISIETKGSKYTIHYLCTQCGHTHRVKASEKDSIEKIIELSAINSRQL